jgi:hypothetical protein
MTPAALQNRCWNHEAREAVCRCPECRRSYCRECVTEHQARLLCAECLRKTAGIGPARKSRMRRLYPAAMALAGFLLAWAIFFGAGRGMIEVVGRMEQSARGER